MGPGRRLAASRSEEASGDVEHQLAIEKFGPGFRISTDDAGLRIDFRQRFRLDVGDAGAVEVGQHALQ